MKIIDSIREAGISHHPHPTQEEVDAIMVDQEAGAIRGRTILVATALTATVLAGVATVGNRLNWWGDPYKSTAVPELDKKPEITVKKLVPEDFGCFVLVEAEVDAAAHLRHRKEVFGKTVTTHTDTTKGHYEGDTEICVNNDKTKDSQGTTITYGTRGGQRVVFVEITNMESHRPRINHDGSVNTETDRSAGTRIHDVFGSDNNEVVRAGLDAVGQWSLGQAACTNEGVNLAQTKIERHYDDDAHNLGYDDAIVTYSHVPLGSDVPQGKGVDGELRERGWEISDRIDIDLGAVSCSTYIDGKPAVANG